MNNSYDSQRSGQHKRGDAPKDALHVEHPLEPRGCLVPGGEGLAIRTTSLGIDGNYIFNEVVRRGKNLDATAVSTCPLLFSMGSPSFFSSD